MIVEVKPSTEKDAQYIGNNMRMEDILELNAVGSRPIESMMYPFSCTNAQTLTLFYDKVPVLCGGTIGESIGTARLWMLATPEAYKEPMKLALLSKKYVDFLQQPYEYMYNYVHTSNYKAVKLLKYLGCTFDKAIMKKKNLNFVKFSRCKNHKYNI